MKFRLKGELTSAVGQFWSMRHPAAKNMPLTRGRFLLLTGAIAALLFVNLLLAHTTAVR